MAEYNLGSGPHFAGVVPDGKLRPEETFTVVHVELKPDLADNFILIARRPYTLIYASGIIAVAGTDVGAVNVMPRKATGAQAPAAGVALITAVYDLKGAVNSVTNFVLTATVADRDFADGDRMALDLTGVPTAVQACLTFYLRWK